MNDSSYKLNKLVYRALEVVLPLFGALLLILALVLDLDYSNVLITISIVVFVISVLYFFLANILVRNLNDRYKEIVIQDAFKARNLLYFSRQTGLTDKNKYAFTQEEFESLNYFKGNDELLFHKNELVVGDVRDVDFRSMDYKYLTNTNRATNYGRIYSFNLRSDNDFILLMDKENNTTLKKLDIKYKGYSFYTNDVNKALGIINVDKIDEYLSKIENYGSLFIKVLNGSLYLIIDKKETFEIENKTYNDIVDDLEREIYIINSVIECFKFKPKIHKTKELKIK